MSASESFAVTMMMGTLEICRICLQTSSPDISGKHEIQDHERRALAAEALQRLPAVGGDGHRVALALEVVAHGIRQRLLILHHEDPGGRGVLRHASAPAAGTS